MTTDLGVEPGTDADVATWVSHSRSWERRAMANAREAARPKPPSELDGPIAMTPVISWRTALRPKRPPAARPPAAGSRHDVSEASGDHLRAPGTHRESRPGPRTAGCMGGQ